MTVWLIYYLLDTADTMENEEFADFTDFQLKSFRYPI